MIILDTNKVKKIKIRMGKKNLTLDRIENYDDIMGIIATNFEIQSDTFVISCLNHEGDFVSLNSHSEYYDALKSCLTDVWTLIIDMDDSNILMLKEKSNRAKEIIDEILDGTDINVEELLETLSKLDFTQTENIINRMLWHGTFNDTRKKKILFLFQTLLRSKFFSLLTKEDVTEPSLYSNVIDTNLEKNFFGSDFVLKQIVPTLQSRLNYNEMTNTREWFLATVASPGSGKTFLCYYLLKLAMSGQLGQSLRQLLGGESINYNTLIEKLNHKIVGVQVNCNDSRNYNERPKITAERDTCLRMLCSYYLKRCSSYDWEKFYKSMCHLMPYRMERIIEVILMDWEQTTAQTQEKPFFFVCYDESSKVGSLPEVLRYLSARNMLIEHFEHVDLPVDGELDDLRKVKIINLVTALNPTEFAREQELSRSKASNRLIKWITLPNLIAYIDDFIPEAIHDVNSKFYYKLGLYWTNGNPRQMEKLLRQLKLQTLDGRVSGHDLMNAIKEIPNKDMIMHGENAWNFVALPLCRFSVKPNFFVSNPHDVKELFLESFYTSCRPFPLVELYLNKIFIDECVTSKLYLQSFVLNQAHGPKNIKICSFVKRALELETELREENWEPYIANIFAAHLTCWSFILSSPDFDGLVETNVNKSNINFHRARHTGCIPLSQLFHHEPTCFPGSRKCGTIMINLNLLDEFAWEVITDFDPDKTILEAGGIYIPENRRNPGWDLCLCFLNENAELSVAFFQSKDSQDEDNDTIGPMVIGKSICHTINQIEIIQKKNLSLDLINCYYILFSRKRVPHFNKWKNSVDSKLNPATNKKKQTRVSNLSQKERDVLMLKDKRLGGYFCINHEDRNTCLGKTFSTFVCRPADSQTEILQTTHNILNMKNELP